MKREPGLVSVVVPCHNGGEFLVEALDGLAAQTYADLEIVFVDDGSTDGSAELAERWATTSAAASRFRDDGRDAWVLARLPRSSGNAAAYTTGFFLGRGEFLAVNDCDDISLPDRIRRQVEYLRTHPGCDIVGTFITSFDHPDGAPGRTERYGRHPLLRDRLRAEPLLPVCFGTMVLRGELFDRVGGLARALPKGHKVNGRDQLFVKKCLDAGARVGNIPEPLYLYRRHTGQMSARELRARIDGTPPEGPSTTTRVRKR